MCDSTVFLVQGMWGIFGKLLKGSIWNTLGLLVVQTTCFRYLSLLGGAVLLVGSPCQQAATMSAYTFTLRVHASPDAPHKPLLSRTSRYGDVRRCKLGTSEPRIARQEAKRPRAARSQQLVCTHTKHNILYTTKVASFAIKVGMIKCMKISQPNFLAACIGVD